MFISWQTFEGFKITVYSIIECVQFLLSEGMQYVLSERFCQDPLEEYFGNQRKIGNRFGYNDNTIRIWVKYLTSVNTKGRYDRKRAWKNVCDDPVLKRKSTKYFNGIKFRGD